MLVREFVLNALNEDLGRGDLFEKIADDKSVDAKIVSKSEGILAGVKYAKELANAIDFRIEFLKNDGDALQKGDTVASLSGSYIEILKCERTLLNMLQHASGIATNVNGYMEALYGMDVALLDTRKTRPLLRVFEKYAVTCGGGRNHRMGLDDCLMLKDTHLAHIKDIKAFMREARSKVPFGSKIEIECESFESACEAMEAGADIVMCDNMGHSEIKRAVEHKNKNHPHIIIEASGNVTKDSIKGIAQCGVDAISCGSLIHQAIWLDFSMKMG